MRRAGSGLRKAAEQLRARKACNERANDVGIDILRERSPSGTKPWQQRKLAIERRGLKLALTPEVLVLVHRPPPGGLLREQLELELFAAEEPRERREWVDRQLSGAEQGLDSPTDAPLDISGE